MKYKITIETDESITTYKFPNAQMIIEINQEYETKRLVPWSFETHRFAMYNPRFTFQVQPLGMPSKDCYTVSVKKKVRAKKKVKK